MGSYIVIVGPNDPLRETAFIAIASLAASVIGGYLGFATFDDRNFMHHLRDTKKLPSEEP